jgi:fumarate hydratase class II
MKIGRTHLQDAVPMRLGQEFGAYARAVERDGEDAAVGLLVRRGDDLALVGLPRPALLVAAQRWVSCRTYSP